MTLPHESPRSQRWRDRRSTFVPNDTVIDPSEFAVDVIDSTSVVKAALRQWHYLATMPVARLSAGLFKNGKGGRSELVGVAVFSVPVNPASIPLHTGLPPSAGVDLGRFVLRDDVAGNGETWFLSRAAKLLRQTKPDVEAFTAYSDPMPRVGPNGIAVKGHVGSIYGTFGAAYRGRRPPRYEHFTPDGAVFPARSLSKIRGRETGWQYAVDELVRRGAQKPATDDLRAWLDHLTAVGFFQRRKHSGMHAYAFALTKAAKIAQRGLPRHAPPRRDTTLPCDVTALPLFIAR